MGRLALMNFIHSLNTPLLVRSRGIHLNGHQVCKGSVVLTCLVIQCAAFWSVGPLQHGATVLAAAGQRWSCGEKHDGGVSTITQTLSAGKPTQACRNHSLYTCRHAGLLVPSETERSSAPSYNHCMFYLQLSHVLSTGTVTDEGILETMRRCWEENQYVLCPHTAVAVWHHYHCPHSPGLNRSGKVHSSTEPHTHKTWSQ